MEPLKLYDKLYEYIIGYTTNNLLNISIPLKYNKYIITEATPNKRYKKLKYQENKHLLTNEETDFDIKHLFENIATLRDETKAIYATSLEELTEKFYKCLTLLLQETKIKEERILKLLQKKEIFI